MTVGRVSEKAPAYPRTPFFVMTAGDYRDVPALINEFRSSARGIVEHLDEHSRFVLFSHEDDALLWSLRYT